MRSGLPVTAVVSPRARTTIASALLLPFVVATLSLPLQIGRLQLGVAWAEAEDKPVVGVVPFTRRGDARASSMASIEDSLREMLGEDGSLTLLPPKVVDTGKASAQVAKEVDTSAARELSAAGKALEKADKLSLNARAGADEGEKILGLHDESEFAKHRDGGLVDERLGVGQHAIHVENHRAHRHRIHRAIIWRTMQRFNCGGEADLRGSRWRDLQPSRRLQAAGTRAGCG